MTTNINHPFAAALLLTLLVSSLPATEYFVATTGNDAHPGTSPDTPFHTIQRGVDSLASGDTLTIAPGEYHEVVTRVNPGSPDINTTIRAAIPGTVVLRGDVAAPVFRKVDGFRFVYVADFTNEATAVNELDTLTILESVPNIQEVEFSPGTFCQDLKTGKIYISPSDLQPAAGHDYTVCILKGRGGIHLLGPQRVIIEGIAATGYNTTVRLPRLHYGNSAADCIPWGLYLSNPTKCVIRNCTAWLNAGGIAIQTGDTGRDNLIEDCTAYGNSSTHSSEGGNIVVFNTHYDIIRRCYAYVGRGNGIRFYTSSSDPVGRMETCRAWGHHKADFHIKSGPLAEAHNCVALRSGTANNRHVYDSIGARPMGIEGDQNNINLSRVPNLDIDSEFADPENLDFRLQSTSRFRSAGRDGRDRGPFPYEPNIFFVRADGDDAADGLSLSTAWRTLKHAFPTLKPGDTLYLSEGRYPAAPLSAGEAADDMIYLRGRGRGTVVLDGALPIVNAYGITFERIDFTDSLSIRDTQRVAFRNCRFVGATLRAENVKELRLTHNVFTGTKQAAVTLGSSAGFYASGNIFNNRHGSALDVDRADAVAYSDYNAYAGDKAAWRIAGSLRNLDQLPPHWESRATARSPVFRTTAGGIVLANPRDFQSGGPLGTALGRYIERRRFGSNDLRVAGPFVQSTTDTTANLEWWSSRRAIFEVAWGSTPGCTNRIALTPAPAYHPGSPLRPFNSFSLTGLEPDSTYAFRLTDARVHDEPSQAAIVPDPYTNLLSFTTAARSSAPRTLYVATNGSDQASGLTPGSAWCTINHAAGETRPGDTVLIAKGVYREHVRVRSTGEEGLPITFKAAPGHKVRLDGAHKTLVAAFSISNKKNIVIDGLYFGNHQRRNTLGLIRASRVDDLCVTRCFQDGRGSGYDPEFLTAGECSNLLVRNCVTISGWDGMAAGRSKNVRFANNVVVRPLIRAICLSEGENVVIDHNIFTDNLSKKRGAWLLAGSAFDRARITDNCFFLRVPESERPAFGRSKGPLAGYEKKAGLVGSNMLANPQFRMAQGNDALAACEYFSEAFLLELHDFPDLFVTKPELIERGIGLQPAAFEDFHFNQGPRSVGWVPGK